MQYRFVVGSAEEAVRLLRERWGEKARVTSVRQVEGTGLARFLGTPRLEIIADVDDDAVAVAPAPAPEPQVSAEPAMPESAPPEPEVKISREENNLARVLEKARLPERLRLRLSETPEWAGMTRKPLRGAFADVVRFLRDEAAKHDERPLTARVAFVGTPGVGKTTALCKQLASDVFIRRQNPAVLKVEAEKPNPAEALAVYCEVIGVPLLRAADEIRDYAPRSRLYLDTPGISAGAQSEIAAMRASLDGLEVESRVLVVNAAYELDLMKEAYDFGAELNATHVVFTHLDEVRQWGKLWEFVVERDLTALFFSIGSNIAGDMAEHVFGSLVAKTFPR